MKRLALWMIGLYRRFFSALKPYPTCRFLPTCSAYAKEAIEKQGLVVGGARAAWRVCRCNPFCAGGYDPVHKESTES